MALGKSAAVVLAAVVAWGTNSRAADPPAPQKMPTPPRAATATPRRPIMELLDQAGVAKTLDDWHLYIDLAVPVGNGLLVRVGKFVTLCGSEVIDPEGNSLYSHSFMFGFAIPFTQTGILASYNLSDDWSITAGITRGWDQAWEDNNSAIDFLGEIKWAQSKDTTFILNVSAGPQRTDNNDDWRILLDFVATHTVSDQLAIAVNADFAW